MKLVYVLGGNFGASGMSSIITKKINWYAEHTDWEIVALLTESANGRDFFFPIHPSVKIVNFDLNFDELDTMPKLRKMLCYRKKQARYKQLFTNFLMEYRPDVVVSAMRREVNFLTDIADGSKKVGELHFCRQTYRVFSHPRLPGFVCRWITHLWQSQLVSKIRKLDAFVVLTDEDRLAWGDLQNVTVIPNFIEQIPECQSNCENKSVVAVGRYTWQKGFDLLFKAWKKVEGSCPDWQLHVYGAGDKAAYQKLVAESDLHNVVLHDATKHVNEVYAQSSVIAFSSRYEGFGMVLIEAMACGIPAVSFACPCGPRDIIKHGEDGYLVEDFDTDALAERLVKLLNDDERRKAMGVKARVNMSRFEQDRVMKRWQDLLLGVLGKCQTSNA